MPADRTETIRSVVRPSARSRGRIVIASGPDEGVAFPLGEPVCVLGRDDAADIRLTAPGVSRHHAKLVVDQEGGVQVVDLGAKNGTYVNGERIKAAQLQHGDTLQLGRAVLRFEREATRASATAASGDAELTPRELEIARLVARGLTNGEIGDVLGISRATVATHLQRAYKRLGLGSRAELASIVTSNERG